MTFPGQCGNENDPFQPVDDAFFDVATSGAGQIEKAISETDKLIGQILEDIGLPHLESLLTDGVNSSPLAETLRTIADHAGNKHIAEAVGSLVRAKKVLNGEIDEDTRNALNAILGNDPGKDTPIPEEDACVFVINARSNMQSAGYQITGDERRNLGRILSSDRGNVGQTVRE